MTVLLICFIILFVLLAVLIAISYVCVKKITLPAVFDEQHEFEVLPPWGYDVKPFYSSVSKTPFEYKTSRGYTLRGEIIPPAAGKVFSDGKGRAVLLVHGYTCNRVTMMSYGELYHRLGFSLVVYEHRMHGKSDKEFCSMGYYESLDAVEVAEYVRTLFPEDTIWGIHGESMGAATTMLAMPELPWMSFCVEDCGYTDLHNEIAASIVFKAGLPPHPLAELCCALFRIWRGFSVSRVRPVDSVPRISAPMLFVHGGQDKFVPTEMVYLLYDAKQDSKKVLKIFDDVPHAKSCLMHHEEYFETLRIFLSDFHII